MNPMTASRVSSPLDGLTRQEVNERVELGQVNDVPEVPSRTVGDIVRTNVVTRFNILLSVLLVVILFVAPPQDALFGVVLIVNTAIGIIQELRAKRTLDHLALLSAPRASVVRDGKLREVAVSEVVLDEVLEVHPGDQLVVDGIVLAVRGLEIDESLLTGEADPISKQPGDLCLSGSFAVAGVGRYRATRVGREAYAARLAEDARKFTLVKSELRSGIDWILAAISWALVPTVGLLAWSQWREAEGGSLSGVKEALRSSVAGAVGMVPQGLVLLTSVAFAVAVVRLGRRSVLVQELPAVEVLARVDIVCFDKTGTLTTGMLTVQGVEELGSGLEVHEPLGALVAADPSPNATLQAIGRAFAEPSGWETIETVPFSSARKWSAAAFAGRGTWVLGAPDVVMPDEHRAVARGEQQARSGRRVLLLAWTDQSVSGEVLPAGLEAAGLVVLGEEIRTDAADTLQYFADQGVVAKVISGDHPTTVASIASRVGLDGAGDAVDARSLPESGPGLADAIMANTVFGRVTPHQKRAMVQALQEAGHTVAMTGDGVNDVLALKDADIGIAMGSGSSAARAVSQLVLLDGSFDTLPSVVAEGRRVIANIERVANLFVTKTVYAVLLALAVGLVGRPFPFVPRHLTLVGSVTIGIPAFFLALAPTAKRASRGFIRRVLRFAIPVGALAAVATFAAYEVAISEEVALIEARTTATIVLASIGLFALIIVSRPLHTSRRILIASMAAILLIAVGTETWRTFFELQMPRTVVVLAAIGIVGMTGLVMYGALKSVGWVMHVPELIPQLLKPLETQGRWGWLPPAVRSRLPEPRPPVPLQQPETSTARAEPIGQDEFKLPAEKPPKMEP